MHYTLLKFCLLYLKITLQNQKPSKNYHLQPTLSYISLYNLSFALAERKKKQKIFCLV